MRSGASADNTNISVVTSTESAAISAGNDLPMSETKAAQRAVLYSLFSLIYERKKGQWFIMGVIKPH